MLGGARRGITLGSGSGAKHDIGRARAGPCDSFSAESMFFVILIEPSLGRHWYSWSKVSSQPVSVHKANPQNPGVLK